MKTSFIHTISTLYLYYINSLQCFRVLCIYYFQVISAHTSLYKYGVYSGMSADVLHSLLYSLLITTSLTDHCSYELLVSVFCCVYNCFFKDFLPIQKIYK
ncbi:hypothetical protein BDB01DRAFT_816964 [Pilobolus umbonatus]|nr:hypothetical protein BDB01DRAFT_816964 [Pilobolus umbonatus]